MACHRHCCKSGSCPSLVRLRIHSGYQRGLMERGSCALKLLRASLTIRLVSVGVFDWFASRIFQFCNSQNGKDRLDAVAFNLRQFMHLSTNGHDAHERFLHTRRSPPLSHCRHRRVVLGGRVSVGAGAGRLHRRIYRVCINRGSGCSLSSRRASAPESEGASANAGSPGSCVPGWSDRIA